MYWNMSWTQRHLQRAFELLKPGGYLLLATPSTSSWDRRLFKNRWTGYSPGHLNLFSLSSIQLCLEHAGWRIIDIRTFEFPIALLWSIKAGIKPKEIAPECAGSNIKRVPLKLGRIILLFFGALTIPLRLLQQQLGGGNELFVVARKDTP